jgi:diacylglycerol kinase family enzyme
LIVAVSGDGVYNEVVNGIMDVEGSSALFGGGGRRKRQ